MDNEKAPTKLLLIPLIFLLIGIGLFAFIKQNKKLPEQENTKTNALIEKPFEFENTKLSVKSDQTDGLNTKSLKTYMIDNQNKFFPSLKLAEKIADELDLTQAAQNKWEDDNYTVTYIETGSYIKIDISDDSTDKQELEETKLEEAAETFLNEIEAWPYQDNTYTTNVNIFEELNLNKVAAIVSFSETVDNFNVYTDLADNSEIYVQFNENGQISQIRYFHIPYKTDDTSFEFKSKSEIEDALEAGEYKFLLSSQQKSQSIQIETITPAYYGSNSTNYLQPVFAIEGENEYGEALNLLVLAYKKESYE